MIVRKLAVIVLLAAALPAPGFAVLGENLDSLRKRFGRPAPQERPQRNVATWFIETEQDERLVYTVTFGADGRSIAEGLKPIGRALLKERMIQEFIDNQLAGHPDAATARTVKPGEKYAFAGRELVCAAGEQVIVDEKNDFLIVAVRGQPPSVIALRAEMLRPPTAGSP